MFITLGATQGVAKIYEVDLELYTRLEMVHSVELCSDVYQVCLTHALSTEKEEVMGLLMGEVDLKLPVFPLSIKYVSWMLIQL